MRYRPATLLLLALVVCLFGACADDAARPATENPAETAAPAPGGATERLFLLDNDGFYELHGEERTLLVARPEASFIYDASMSPDGTTVALAVQPPPEQTATGYNFGVDLYVARDGGEPMPVALHERIAETMSRPNWLSPDRIIFAIIGRDDTGAADLRIELLDLNSGSRERLVENALEPALSPDRSTLAFVRYDEQTGGEVLMLLDLTSGNAQPLLPEHQLMANVANIAWAPEGDQLAFAAADPISAIASGRASGAAAVHPTLRDVWLVNVDGTGLHRITEIADASLSLAWSADGRHVYGIGDTGFWRIDTMDGALELIGPPNLAGRVQTLFP